MSNDKKFRALKKELKTKFPAVAPVYVYRRDLRNECCLGRTDALVDIEGEFIIRFRITIHWPMMWDMIELVLIHEWAHALSWQDGKGITDHGPEWGIAMSRIYQGIVEL